MKKKTNVCIACLLAVGMTLNAYLPQLAGAKATASSAQTKTVVSVADGTSFEKPEYVESLRIIFDLDFSRESVSVNKKMRVFAQKCNEGADFKPMKVAKTLVKAFSVYADDELIYSTNNYHNSRFTLHVGRELSTLSVRFDETWGEETIHLFSCDIK